jgi:MSHA biogenesis protein MshN
MSVVNKMLQDLEARQSQSDEIKADYQAPPKKQSKLLVLVLLILAITAIIFAITDIDQLFAETNKVTATTKSQSLPDAVTKKMTLASEKVPLEPVELHKTSDSNQTAKANIEIVATAAEVELELELVNNVSANEPITPQALTAATPELVPLQNIATQDKPQEIPSSPELITQPTAAQAPSFSMTGSSEENNSSSLKQRIAESLNNDNLDLARPLLYELLETEPNNIKARKKLASLLFAQGNYAQSKQLLVRGIELHPTQGDLRLMLARLHVVQKEPLQAMNVLTEFQPNTNDQTEYLAYRAALAQQLKQPKLAKSDYQTLTNIESTNAKWWLGLAIVEDQLGELNKAVQAYTKAKSLGQLDSSVNDFMQQRISALAGAP